MARDVIMQKLKGRIMKCDKCPPEYFFRSQWQTNATKLSKSYVVYKWCHAVMFLVILTFSLAAVGEEPPKPAYFFKWPIYLTNWSLMINTAQAVLAVIFLSRALAASFGKDGELSTYKMRVSIKLYWILHSTSLSLSIGVSVIYWLCVYDPEIHKLNATNFLVHSVNSVLMIVDCIVVCHPLKFWHIMYPVIVVITYTVFNWVYSLLGGTSRNGNKYIYPMMDWDHPSKCFLFVISGIVLLFIIHSIMCVIFMIKRIISQKINSIKKTMKNNIGLESVEILRNSNV